MLRLPVSGLRVSLSAPTGHEDLMLIEAPDLDLSLGLALLNRLAHSADGKLDLMTLVVTDYEALLLGLHRAAFGGQIQADLRCGTKDCGSRMEISFEIDEYLAHKRPRRPRTVADLSSKSGWFELGHQGISVTYRLPTTADLGAVSEDAEPEREVLRRCVEGPLPDGPIRRKVEKAMEAQAPSFSGPLPCRCSECGSAMHFFFDVQAFVLHELRGQAAFVYQDTHLLALHYHWPEAQILEMPHQRRMQYAEMLRGQA